MNLAASIPALVLRARRSSRDQAALARNRTSSAGGYHHMTRIGSHFLFSNALNKLANARLLPSCRRNALQPQCSTMYTYQRSSACATGSLVCSRHEVCQVFRASRYGPESAHAQRSTIPSPGIVRSLIIASQ